MMTTRILPFVLIALARGQLNNYTKSLTATGLGLVETWESTTPFKPKSGTSFGEITIGEVMSMEFDMTFHGRSDSVSANKKENFFRIGFDAYDGNHCRGSLAHYPSLWIGSDNEIPYMVLTQDDCEAVTTELTGLGDLNEGDTYRFEISWNSTHLTVFMKNYNATVDNEWSESWTRSATHMDYLGDSVPVWFMTNKFSTQQYNIGNGTFYSIIISSEYATDAPTTAMPTVVPTFIPTTVPTDIPTHIPTTIPTDVPSSDPTKIPSMEPTENPTFNAAIQKSTAGPENVINKANTESSSISPLTIAIIVIVVLFVVLACHAVFLCGRYRRRKHAMKNEDGLAEIADEEGNIGTDVAVHAPDEVVPQDDPEDTPDPIYEDEPLEQLSKPDDQMLALNNDESGFVHKREDTESHHRDMLEEIDPDDEQLDVKKPILVEASSTHALSQASSTRLESQASSTEVPTQHYEN